MKDAKYFLAEIVGTFMLTFIGSGAEALNAATNGQVTHLGIALAFGLVVVGIVYAIGPISGSNVNPAISISLLLTGYLSIKKTAYYIVAQIIGAVLGSLVLFSILHHAAIATVPAPSIPVPQAWPIEALATGILMFVVMAFVTEKQTDETASAIGIGAIVVVVVLLAGQISGGCLNPALAIGSALVSHMTRYLWFYVTAPTVGALGGTLLFELIRNRKPALVHSEEAAGTTQHLAAVSNAAPPSQAYTAVQGQPAYMQQAVSAEHIEQLTSSVLQMQTQIGTVLSQMEYIENSALQMVARERAAGHSGAARAAPTTPASNQPQYTAQTVRTPGNGTSAPNPQNTAPYAAQGPTPSYPSSPQPYT